MPGGHGAKMGYTALISALEFDPEFVEYRPEFREDAPEFVEYRFILACCWPACVTCFSQKKNVPGNNRYRPTWQTRPSEPMRQWNASLAR